MGNFIKIEDILAKEQSIIVNDNNEDDEENSNDEKVLIPSFCICLHRNYVAEYFIVDNHVPIFGERDNDDNGGCLEHEYWSLIIEKALANGILWPVATGTEMVHGLLYLQALASN